MHVFRTDTNGDYHFIMEDNTGTIAKIKYTRSTKEWGFEADGKEMLTMLENVVNIKGASNPKITWQEDGSSCIGTIVSGGSSYVVKTASVHPIQFQIDGVAKAQLNTDGTFQIYDLVNAASLATDANGKIIAGSGGSANIQDYHIGYWLANTAKRFPAIAGDGATASIKSNEQGLVTHDSGKLLKVIIQSDTIMGSTSITLENSGSVLATKVVNMSAADTTYEFDFTTETNTFSSGDVLFIGVDPTSGPNGVAMTLVVEYDN